MKTIQNLIKKEEKKLFDICDAILNERFKTSKHDQQWSDDLFRKYQTTKTKILTLREVVDAIEHDAELIDLT